MALLSEDQIRVSVQQIVAEFHPLKIILFGSHATGKPSLDSDVDLLVTMNTTLRPIQQAFEIRRRISFPFPLDLIVRTPNQINQRQTMGDPFIKGILSRGKVLYEAA